MASKSNEAWAEELATVTACVLAAADITIDSEITTPDARFAKYIDHTLLKPDATPAQIDKLCDEALKYKFKSCCVNSHYIPQVTQRLAGSDVIPCVVVGFPLGAMKSSAKAFETSTAVSDGAKEIDMVLNIGALKSRDYALVSSDISSVVTAAAPYPVKVILETVFLTTEEKIHASYIAAEAGAAFVKTCTGFLGGAASKEDVALMKKSVAHRPEVKVKASAGVRSFETAREMIQAGADRIGTSSGTAIFDGANVAPGTY
ncbi:deoxyribose-phosphate aldolase [Ascodesmis nigricans]|uniref:deoxyribose-phosphate aldolase n=1 Tax=Ascodesmis nigricans TaxID=341454 RepID=A0A4S2MLS6_9PEZI|nr:deoxyribose-phosphate aldolase [Ascodesmis nigricans]